MVLFTTQRQSERGERTRRLDNDDQEDDQGTNLLCWTVTLAHTTRYWATLPILSTDSQSIHIYIVKCNLDNSTLSICVG